MFFVFDGVDGAGKSTQLEMFAEWLTQQGLDVLTCNDPGTTALGNEMRRLLLGRHEMNINMRSEMLMFMTARAQLVAEVIRPALEQGRVVVCDRYVFSTVVYQGHAGKMDPDHVRAGNRIATNGLMADATFVLDLDIQTARSRMGNSLDRMESRGPEYFQQVREGFLAEAKLNPETVKVIDASQNVEQIHHSICQHAQPFIDRNSATQNGNKSS